jgi:FkbM family methyltransferase
MTTDMLRKLDNRVRRPLWARRLRGFVEVDGSKMVRLGTSHGGWALPAATVRSGATAVCVGAGEDISFDVELNKRGLNVFTLDPTPRATKHVAHLLAAAKGGPPTKINNSLTDVYDLRGFDETRFIFVDAGLWDENKTMRFFAPKDPNHVSHSIMNLQRTNDWFEAKCMTLQTFCTSYKIGQIDILKLDIEGSEYAVLGNMIENGLLPHVLCVEFDELRNPLDGGVMERILSQVKQLAKSGYKFRHLENSNALFVR